MTPSIPSAAVRGFLLTQDGVISRRQVLEAGDSSAVIRRMLRRREWVKTGSGLYVNHTGPLTWSQRAWCAVLGADPAALSHQSAVHAVGGTVDGKQCGIPIHIAVGSRRNVAKQPGVVVHYDANLDDHAAWHTHPPRIRVEHAVVTLASAASTETVAVARLTEAVNARVTTVERLRDALRTRRSLRRKAFLGDVLKDIADGTCSVLERRYRLGVEQAHGLPRPVRQSPTATGRPGFRDAEYPHWRLVIELDGRAGHDDAPSRDRDLERDLDAVVGAGLTTVRLGWGQVGRPCTTAQKVGRLLRRRGWTGAPVPCSDGCAVAGADEKTLRRM